MTNVVLITGATSGIGRELAVLFARAGRTLVLVARSESELKQRAQELKLAGSPEVFSLAQDLSVVGAAEKVWRFTQKHSLEIETLINNAGFGTYGEFVNLPLETETAELQLNVVALTQLCKLYLPSMVKRSRGQIMNVASVASFMPGPLMAVYFATKAYVLSFSVALHEELKGTGVVVTALCPGPTETQFADRAQAGQAPMFKGRLRSAASVAEVGYAALERAQAITVVGLSNQLLTRVAGWIPRTWLARMVKVLQASKKQIA